jgi:aryl-alcohol dehydrogenase-like predicted oxidoreductase
MNRRPLGRSDRTLTPIGLGCVTFGREIDQDQSFRILDYAVEKGISWLDTAEAYGGGQSRAYRRDVMGIEDEREVSGEMSSSENIIGRWLAQRQCRDQIDICTKVNTGSDPDNIRRAFNDSLERLQTDHVEIYKLHGPKPEPPIAETLGALNELVDSGKVEVIGCSNFSAEQLREALEASAAHGFARFEIIQPGFSLANSSPRKELFPLCREEEIAITSFGPLGSGFLTGKYTPDRDQFPKGSRYHIAPGHADAYFTDHNFDIVEKLRQKSADVGLPMERLAMAWVMAHKEVTSPLVGARETAHIDNALMALELELDADLFDEMTGWLDG